MRRWLCYADDPVGISEDNGFRAAFHLLLEHSPAFKVLTKQYRANTSGRRGRNNFTAFGDALKVLADKGAAGGVKLRNEPMPYGLFVRQNFLQWDGETVFFSLLDTGENYMVIIEHRYDGPTANIKMTAGGWVQMQEVQ